MKPTAKRFVLELLTAADAHAGNVGNLIAAGDVMGIDANSIRVALARLVGAGTLELVRRGEYRLAPATRALTRQVTSWRELERSVRRWDGGWVLVQRGELPRSDRAALRRTERALRLLGFRTLARELEIRPDNLAGGVAGVRDQLHALGLPGAAIVVRASELDIATERRARTLWTADRLDVSYRQTTTRIERFLVALEDLAPRAAAREAFAFGGDVLRRIMFDPKLPEPLVDVAARRALVEAACRLDSAGRRLWAELFGLPRGLVVTSEVRHVA